MSASEHTFGTDVLVSGDNVDSYTAGAALTAGEPVAQSGDYEVTASGNGGPFTGVAAYDVASGEEVPVIKRDCEARVEAAEALSAGDALVPDGAGAFRQADNTNNGETGVALANEAAGAAGDTVEIEIFGAKGATL